MGTRVPAQKHTQEPVPPNWEPGSRALCPSSEPKTHSRNRFPQTGNRVPEHSAQVKAASHAAGTGSPKLGTGFQGTLPKFRTKNTQQEPVPPNWEPGSRALCPSSEPKTHSRNRFPQTGNRVPEHSAQVKAASHAAGTGSPKLGTGFQGILPSSNML